MANDRNDNGNGSREGELTDATIADQVRMLTEQVLASQQAQVAIQQTQQVMMEALKTLQQTLATTHSSVTIPSSTPEEPNLTPQNLGRQGISQAVLSQVHPVALNFTPNPAPAHQTPINPSQTPFPAEQRTNPIPPAFPQTPTNSPTILPPEHSLLTLDQLKFHVKELVQQETSTNYTGLDLDLRPPYPEAVVNMPYPEGYVVPKFTKFDGKRGNAREHVVRFIDSLGVHAQDSNLRLREFSKSLTHKAYTWYANLPVGSVKSWDDLVKKFYAKFFYVDERLTTLHLMRETQKQGEDLLLYV